MSQTKATIRPLQYEELGVFCEIHDGYDPFNKTRGVEEFQHIITNSPFA